MKEIIHILIFIFALAITAPMAYAEVDTEVSYAVKKTFMQDFGYNWDEASDKVQEEFLREYNASVLQQRKVKMRREQQERRAAKQKLRQEAQKERIKRAKLQNNQREASQAKKDRMRRLKQSRDNMASVKKRLTRMRQNSKN